MFSFVWFNFMLLSADCKKNATATQTLLSKIKLTWLKIMIQMRKSSQFYYYKCFAICTKIALNKSVKRVYKLNGVPKKHRNKQRKILGFPECMVAIVLIKLITVRSSPSLSLIHYTCVKQSRHTSTQSKFTVIRKYVQFMPEFDEHQAVSQMIRPFISAIFI